jgi:DNA invertase Pin-like site-specific DNA recombinase
MEKQPKTIKYFAYVRKSSEGEEKQALSISSQLDKAKEFFSDLNIVEVLEEKHSAFKPYSRPVFENMIKRIRKGEATGIIAWHPDRLSRNEIDASTVTYLVRTGVIDDLKFGSYNFDNSPEGIMMLQLALSQSQYFSSKLGKDVRRGLEKKFQMGYNG